MIDRQSHTSCRLARCENHATILEVVYTSLGRSRTWQWITIAENGPLSPGHRRVSGANSPTPLPVHGANVVLVARRNDRIEAIASDLKSTFSIDAVAVPADLADPASPADIEGTLAARGTNIDILINNAGFGLPGLFGSQRWEDHERYIRLMITSYAELTHRFLPGMAERGYGRIIQVASVAGLIPGGKGHTLYGGTKAFLINFSQALAAEYRDRGVHATALCPGFTLTEFHDVNGTRDQVSKLPGFMMMDAKPVVEGRAERSRKKACRVRPRLC